VNADAFSTATLLRLRLCCYGQTFRVERPARRQASGLPHSLPEKPSALADGVFTVERQSKLETTAARTLFLVERLALKIGGIEDEA
jgi:hypothetical protein